MGTENWAFCCESQISEPFCTHDIVLRRMIIAFYFILFHHHALL